MSEKTLKAAQDPNTAPGQLLMLAKVYPSAVLANQALDLVSLEDPGLWRSIVRTARSTLHEAKMDDWAEHKSPNDQKSFWLNCAWHLLPVVEQTTFGKGLLRRALLFGNELQTTKVHYTRVDALKKEYLAEINETILLVKDQEEKAQRLNRPPLLATRLIAPFLQHMKTYLSTETLPLRQVKLIADVWWLIDETRAYSAWDSELTWQESQL